MTGSGTDHAIEERQLRQRDEKAGVEQWVEHVFFAVGEVTFLGIPAFMLLLGASPNRALKFAAIFAWATLALATGSFRGEWNDVEWPRMTPVLFALRLGYYNAVILAVSYAAAMVDLALLSPVVTAGVSVALSACCAWAFPRLAAIADARLPN